MVARAASGSSTTAHTLRRQRARAERFPDVADGTAPEPAGRGLKALREAAAACKRCELWRPATQTVFGRGPARARILMLGEQPGDREDIAGEPFVGPAGLLLRRALDELGIDAGTLYLTNAVKHFKFEPRGKRRVHKAPTAAEQKACHLWFERELAVVKPEAVVCLGAIAAKAVLGSNFPLMQQRGRWQALADGRRAFATVHPSWVLRQRGRDQGDIAYRGFRDDLALLLMLDATG